MDRYDLMWITRQSVLDSRVKQNPELFDTAVIEALCTSHGCLLQNIDTAPLDTHDTIAVVWSVLSDNSTAIEALTQWLTDRTHEHIAYWNLETEEQWEERLTQQVTAAYSDIIYAIKHDGGWTFGPSISGFSDDDFNLDSVYGTLTVRSHTHMISIGIADSGPHPILIVPRPENPSWEAVLTRLDDLLSTAPDRITVTADTINMLLDRIRAADQGHN